MALVKVFSAAVVGLEGRLVEIEIDSQGGLPGQSIVGLPDQSVRESRDRVRSAMENSGFAFPPGYFVVNLAPADIRKEGPLYDLPIALGMLAHIGQLPVETLAEVAVVGELSLDGGVRGVNGILPISIDLKKWGIKKIIVPAINADEAALAEGMEVYPVASLQQAAAHLKGEIKISPHQVDIAALLGREGEGVADFAEVKGQGHVKRGLEVAAAGGHNVLLVGPPGSGKTMLARRLPGILAPLSHQEALELTRLYSVAGLLERRGSLVAKRPFRSPHHTTSDIGIIGGGRIPRPGEVSLSHFGVLFLDEFPEFKREVLEVLRQPLEDGRVTISRAQSTLTYPAQFMLVAAMNPCPCGNYLDPIKNCVCQPHKLKNYWGKLSGPLLDRIDIQLEVPRLNQGELLSRPAGDSSAVIRERVAAARTRQRERLAGSKVLCNARMSSRQIREHCQLEPAAADLLKSAITQLKLSGRGYDRTLKVSRTIADLAGKERIGPEDLAEALQYRALNQENG